MDHVVGFFDCVGLNKSQFTAWTSKLGFFWFCDSCRRSFDAADYDREKTIMKALRELLIRIDSMDTRIGSFGENLRRINKTLFDVKQNRRSSTSSQHQASFFTEY